MLGRIRAGPSECIELIKKQDRWLAFGCIKHFPQVRRSFTEHRADQGIEFSD